MESKKIPILIVIIVILAIVLGVILYEISKDESNLAIAENEVNVGDSLVVVLSDSHGYPIGNGEINVRLTDEDGTTFDEKIRTGSDGKAELKMKNEGVYSVECKFNGNIRHASSSVTDDVNVEKATTKVVGNEKTTSSSSNYPEYNPAIGSYRTVEHQQELALIETSSGQKYVLAGDGYYAYGGHDSKGYIKLGSFVGKY